MNPDNTQIIQCPNCGTEHHLTGAKGPCWKTLDSFQSLVAVITPMLIGLAVVVVFRIAEHFCNYTPSIRLLLGVFFSAAFISFPIMVRAMTNYQRNMLQHVGVQLYSVTCACHNEFIIIRSTESKQAELLTENTPNTPE